MVHRVYNFSAGPSAIPLPVLEKARDELLDFKGAGMSVMEMSHRSAEFTSVIEGAQDAVRRVLEVPDNYSILFLQGGATLQFSMIPMNLYVDGKPMDYIHTGNWTKKAIGEAKKVGPVNLAGTSEGEKFSRIPPLDSLSLSPSPSYLYICSNNTVAGTQYKQFPETGVIPLVADMSSDIMSRKLDVSKFALIFAGAQKNLGPSGVTLVIVRNDLAERASDKLPSLLQYRTQIAANSLSNTPPTFGIYMLGLVMEWIEEQGGLDAIEKRNEEKAKILYNAIDATEFYSCPVNTGDRSLMNVVWRIKGGDEELEKKFVAESKEADLSGLKGHRSVGGLRASIYNAMSIEGVQTLVDFMKQFEEKNG